MDLENLVLESKNIEKDILNYLKTGQIKDNNLILDNGDFDKDIFNGMNLMNIVQKYLELGIEKEDTKILDYLSNIRILDSNYGEKKYINNLNFEKNIVPKILEKENKELINYFLEKQILLKVIINELVDSSKIELIDYFLNKKEYQTQIVVNLLSSLDKKLLNYYKENNIVKNIIKNFSDKKIRDMKLYTEESVKMICQNFDTKSLNNILIDKGTDSDADIFKQTTIGNLLLENEFSGLKFFLEHENIDTKNKLFLEVLVSYLVCYENSELTKFYDFIKKEYKEESDELLKTIKKNYGFNYFQKYELNNKIIKKMIIKNNERNKI